MIETLTVTPAPETTTTPTAKPAKAKKARKSKAKAKKAAPKAPSNGTLRLPQFRVLKVLLPDASGERPFMDRSRLEKKAGFNEGSGTLQVALLGRTIDGKTIPGLVGLELVKRTEIELDNGAKERGYQITAKGVKAAERFLADHDGKAPKARDKELCVNARYKAKGKKAKKK